MTNHWWQVPLYVTARGLDTSIIHYGSRAFEVELDLLASQLEVRTSDGARERIPLGAGPIAAFHRRFFELLHDLGIEVAIQPLATEIADTLYLDRDATRRPFDPEWARRFHAALIRVDRVMKEFRGAFTGKASPVHFFWGGFDLSVPRFSGRPAPPPPGGAPHVRDSVMREAYSQEVSSAGFWPGGLDCAEPIFFSYAWPEPAGFAAAKVMPGVARYEAALKNFVLPYETVRSAPNSDELLKKFFESTYAAAAELGHWPPGLLR